jgi:branched-subunit amino acid transport protein
MSLEPLTLWLTMLAIGLGTFLIRFSFIWVFGRGAVLPSFVFPQQAPFSVENPRLWAGLIAAAVAWRTRNMLLTIAAGMVSLWIVSLL